MPIERGNNLGVYGHFVTNKASAGVVVARGPYVVTWTSKEVRH
jgi:hypothetical protein